MKYLFHYLLFIIIILIFAYINSTHKEEAFTPKIREFYNPYIRHARIYTKKTYNTHKNNIHTLFRKFGIM